MSTLTVEGRSRTWTRITMAGMALISLVGLIHLLTAPEYLEEATYVGVLFLANAAGAALCAYGIYRGQSWGWLLGVLIAGGAFVGFIVSRTVGLPGAPGILQEGFFDPPGILSLIVEALFVGLYLAKTFGRSLFKA